MITELYLHMRSIIILVRDYVLFRGKDAAASVLWAGTLSRR